MAERHRKNSTPIYDAVTHALGCAHARRQIATFFFAHSITTSNEFPGTRSLLWTDIVHRIANARNGHRLATRNTCEFQSDTTDHPFRWLASPTRNTDSNEMQ